MLSVRMSTSSAMEALLSNPRYSDVRFIAGADAVEIPAHRSLLVLHSEVLSTMFQAEGWMESEHSTIALPDVSPSTVRAFLQFCYCGSVCTNHTELIALLELCHLYQAQQMVAALGDALAQDLSAGNALQLYAVGCMYSPTLKSRALAYISLESKEVFNMALQSGSTSLAECSKEQLQEVLSCDALGLGEEEVYKVLLHWGRCHQQDSHPPLSEILGDLLPCVRWSLMSQDWLRAVGREGVVPHELLLPYLLNPGVEFSSSRTCLGPPNDADKSFWLKHLYNSDHAVYVWHRSIADGDVHSPHFCVGGLTFSVRSALDESAFTLFIRAHGPTSESRRLVIAKFTGLSNAGPPEWFAGTIAWPCVELRKGRGWPVVATYAECHLNMRRLCGPDREHLRFHIDVRVEGECKFRMLKSPDGSLETFELRLPATVLELDVCRFPVKALNSDWYVSLEDRACKVTIEGGFGLSRADSKYEFSMTFVPPPNASLPIYATPKTVLTEQPKREAWPLIGGMKLAAAGQMEVVWPSGEIVLRCCLQSIPKAPLRDPVAMYARSSRSSS